MSLPSSAALDRKRAAEAQEPPPVRGATPEALARPAAEFLKGVPWDGPAPNPDTLDAATFLAWL